MSRIPYKNTLTVLLTVVTRTFIAHSDAIWHDEGIQCPKVETQESRLGTQDGHTFIPLANPKIVGSIENSYKLLKKNLTGEIPYTRLTPYTDFSLLEPLAETFFEVPTSWHPFYARF